MIFPQIVTKRHYQTGGGTTTLGCGTAISGGGTPDTGVGECRSGPFQLNLTTDCKADTASSTLLYSTMSETWAAELPDVRCPLPDMTALPLSSFQLADILPAVSP